MSEINEEITSVQLLPIGNIEGMVTVGDFIANDYILRLISMDDGYILRILKGTETQEARLLHGVGIDSIVQGEQSDEDEGENSMIITLTDGSQAEFTWKNGSKGDKGDAGMTAEEIEAINQAERARSAAETLRREGENNRQQVEVSRQRDEILRNNGENERESQEAIRVSAESTRVTNETKRNQAENNRIYYERIRSEAEIERVSNEAERIQEWSEIKEDMLGALTLLNNRSDTIEPVVQEAKDATELAVDAYVNANRASELINDAIQSIPTQVEEKTEEKVDSAIGNIIFRIYEDGTLQFNIQDDIEDGD